MRIACSIALAAAGAAGLAGVADAQPVEYHYPDVAEQRGIGAYQQIYNNGGGVAAADYDDDGDIDLYIPCGPGFPNQLYQNQGDGTYIDIAPQLGVDLLDGSRVALWFDYNNDSRLDLVVGHDKSLNFDDPPPANTLHLFRQQPDGTFEDVTAEAELAGNFHEWFHGTSIGGFAAGDFNNDGWLDLVMTQWFGHVYLFLNKADGTFTDISDSAGLRPYEGDGRGVSDLMTGFQPIAHDFNGDGWQDLFIAVDFDANYLWINQGDETFVNQAASAGCDHAFNCMGVAPGDYDRDGDIDLYVTNIYECNDGAQEFNLLYRNDTDGGVVQFTDVAQAMGVEHGYWGWGATFLDADCDGVLELAEVNGYRYLTWRDPSRFFVLSNNGDGPAYDIAQMIGMNEPEFGSGLAGFDSDRDGDIDLVRTAIDDNGHHVRLNECVVDGRANNNHWISIRPRMEGANTRAIGAVVRATVDGTTTAALITAGTSYLSQQPAEAHFGLGASSAVDTLTIDWPNGAQTVLTDVAGDQVRTITLWQCPGDVNASGAVNVFDLLALLGQWGQPTNPRADVNSSGAVDETDVQELIMNWGGCEGRDSAGVRSALRRSGK